MPIPVTGDARRHYRVSEEQSFRLASGEVLFSLDDLSEAINLISPETFQTHVNSEKNDFANWVEYVFDEKGLAQALREHPTPLRMMISIEKFLRSGNTPSAPAPAAPQA